MATGVSASRYRGPNQVSTLNVCKPHTFPRDALKRGGVPEKSVSGLLLDLGHGGLVLLPSAILNSLMIRHEDVEDLGLLLPIRKALAAFERDDDLPGGFGNINPLEFAL